MNSRLTQLTEWLQRWWWLLALGALLGAAASFVVNRLTPAYYVATTTLAARITVDDTTDESIRLAMSEVAVNKPRAIAKSEAAMQKSAVEWLPIYVQMFKSARVQTAVLEELNVGGRSKVPQVRITAVLVPNTYLIEVRVRSRNAQLSRQVAEALPGVFTRVSAELFGGQSAVAQQNLSQAMADVTAQLARTNQAIKALLAAPDLSSTESLESLQAELAILRQSRLALFKRSVEIDLTTLAASNNLIVVEPPLTPSESTRLSTWLVMALGGLAGVLSAGGLAGLIGRWDDRVRSAAALERITQLPVLGSIMRWATDAVEVLALREPRSPIVEAFRMLRTNLRFADAVTSLHSLLITSDQPGEGKSTVAANLAVVMAQAGLKVVLIDADLRRPTQHQKFAVTSQWGLTDILLRDPADWPGMTLACPVPDVVLIPSGALPPNPAELLGSRKMQQLLEFLRGTYDLIIIDAPPVQPVTDALVLARQVDGVLWVAAYGITHPGALAWSKQQADRIGARSVGVVLNRVPRRRHWFRSMGGRSAVETNRYWTSLQ